MSIATKIDSLLHKSLIKNLPQHGRVEWIGLREQRKQPLTIVDAVEAKANHGLLGDRSSLKAGKKRQVSLIQYEHLVVMSSIMGFDVTPQILRRNVVVSGINLLSLKDKEFQIGSARFLYSGLCHPCSRMEEALGDGGYNAMRGHGGILATVIESGTLSIGDRVTAV